MTKSTIVNKDLDQDQINNNSTINEGNKSKELPFLGGIFPRFKDDKESVVYMEAKLVENTFKKGKLYFFLPFNLLGIYKTSLVYYNKVIEIAKQNNTNFRFRCKINQKSYKKMLSLNNYNKELSLDKDLLHLINIIDQNRSSRTYNRIVRINIDMKDFGTGIGTYEKENTTLKVGDIIDLIIKENLESNGEYDMEIVDRKYNNTSIIRMKYYYSRKANQYEIQTKIKAKIIAIKHSKANEIDQETELIDEDKIDYIQVMDTELLQNKDDYSIKENSLLDIVITEYQIIHIYKEGIMISYLKGNIQKYGLLQTKHVNSDKSIIVKNKKIPDSIVDELDLFIETDIIDSKIIKIENKKTENIINDKEGERDNKRPKHITINIGDLITAKVTQIVGLNEYSVMDKTMIIIELNHEKNVAYKAIIDRSHIENISDGIEVNKKYEFVVMDIIYKKDHTDPNKIIAIEVSNRKEFKQKNLQTILDYNLELNKIRVGMIVKAIIRRIQSNTYDNKTKVILYINNKYHTIILEIDNNYKNYTINRVLDVVIKQIFKNNDQYIIRAVELESHNLEHLLKNKNHYIHKYGIITENRNISMYHDLINTTNDQMIRYHSLFNNDLKKINDKKYIAKLLKKHSLKLAKCIKIYKDEIGNNKKILLRLLNNVDTNEIVELDKTEHLNDININQIIYLLNNKCGNSGNNYQIVNNNWASNKQNHLESDAINRTEVGKLSKIIDLIPNIKINKISHFPNDSNQVMINDLCQGLLLMSVNHNNAYESTNWQIVDYDYQTNQHLLTNTVENKEACLATKQKIKKDLTLLYVMDDYLIISYKDSFIIYAFMINKSFNRYRSKTLINTKLNQIELQIVHLDKKQNTYIARIVNDIIDDYFIDINSKVSKTNRNNDESILSGFYNVDVLRKNDIVKAMVTTTNERKKLIKMRILTSNLHNIENNLNDAILNLIDNNNDLIQNYYVGRKFNMMVKDVNVNNNCVELMHGLSQPNKETVEEAEDLCCQDALITKVTNNNNTVDLIVKIRNQSKLGIVKNLNTTNAKQYKLLDKIRVRLIQNNNTANNKYLSCEILGNKKRKVYSDD